MTNKCCGEVVPPKVVSDVKLLDAKIVSPKFVDTVFAYDCSGNPVTEKSVLVTCGDLDGSLPEISKQISTIKQQLKDLGSVPTVQTTTVTYKDCNGKTLAQDTKLVTCDYLSTVVDDLKAQLTALTSQVSSIGTSATIVVDGEYRFVDAFGTSIGN